MERKKNHSHLNVCETGARKRITAIRELKLIQWFAMGEFDICMRKSRFVCLKAIMRLLVMASGGHVHAKLIIQK